MPFADSAAAQLRRLLDLLPRYATDRGLPPRAVPIAEIADALGCTPKQVRLDLESLRDHEDVAGFVEKFLVTIDADTVSIESKGFLRPMRLGFAEARALELGLSLLRRERPADEQQAIDDALGLVRDHLALGTVHEEEGSTLAGHQAAGDPALLDRLREARRQRRAVLLTYAPADGAPTERLVHVYGMTYANGMWYAVAYVPAHDAMRSYRIDRVLAVVATAETYTPPANFQAHDFVKNGRVFRAADAPVLRVRFSAAVARWIAEHEGVPLAADGTVEVAWPLADEQWAVRHLLQYGAEATVLEPSAVRMRLTDTLRALLADA